MTEVSLGAVSPIIKFLPYQKRWLADKARFKLGRFARQTGKTFTTSGEIVEDCVDAIVRGAIHAAGYETLLGMFRKVQTIARERGERLAKSEKNTPGPSNNSPRDTGAVVVL